MNSHGFFLPTPKYKEYMLLETIEDGASLTQREIARKLGIAVSMVNQYLIEFESRGLVKRIYNSKKDVKYEITDKGIERKKLLNIDFLKSSLDVYNEAKSNVLPYLESLIIKGYKNIYLYGAGEVAELFLNVIKHDLLPLNVLGLIDDDINKVGTFISDIEVYSRDVLLKTSFDCVIISSYKHKDIINSNILSLGISGTKIVEPYNGESLL